MLGVGLVCEPCPVHCSSPTGSVAAGTAVAFDGRPSSDDRVGAFPGTVVRWDWSFGDGGSATGAQVSHAFASAGTYAVSLTLYDNDGKLDGKTLNIVVTRASPPPPPPPPPGTGYAATVLADAPVGYWRPGEAAGSTSVNRAAGPNGQYQGSPTLGAGGAIGGDPDTAVDLGPNGYISVPDAASLDTADAFTIEGWVKRSAINATQGLFAKGTRSYQVYIDSANRLTLRQTGIGDIARSTVQLSELGTFHHLVVTKQGAHVHLYIDGVDRTGIVTNRTLVNTASDLALGAGAGFLNGTLDDVAIYDRFLDPASVAAHHTAAAGS